MKITAKELNELIHSTVLKSLKESANADSGEDKKLKSYLDKADKVMADCCGSLLKLVEEGEALALEDLEAKNRNAMVLTVLGAAKKAHGVCVHAVEHLKKSTG